jgi:hypothetical protein
MFFSRPVDVKVLLIRCVTGTRRSPRGKRQIHVLSEQRVKIGDYLAKSPEMLNFIEWDVTVAFSSATIVIWDNGQTKFQKTYTKPGKYSENVLTLFRK